MSKMPKTPDEQRSFGNANLDGVVVDRRDTATGLQSGQPGDADANLAEQGRFGNLQQNLTTQHKSGNR
ncbi:hypothetical protein [Brevundimonas sp.]|jgi:hypothetical protein|uniref:hypothetical protein n=1 Tax=Brevundimonas sp. TaxID=1871086 RepID=UPI0037BE617F